jgi:hypothetical protein
MLTNLFDAHYERDDDERYVVGRASPTGYVCFVIQPTSAHIDMRDVLWMQGYVRIEQCAAAYNAWCQRFEQEGYTLIERR